MPPLIWEAGRPQACARREAGASAACLGNTEDGCLRGLYCWEAVECCETGRIAIGLLAGDWLVALLAKSGRPV